MKILIADDHPMVRDALAHALHGFDEGLSVVEASDHDSLRRLRAARPALPVLVVWGRTEPGTVRAMMEAGASGFVPKTESAAILLHALRTVLAGGGPTPAPISSGRRA